MKDTLTSSLVKSNRKWRILRFDNDPDFWEKNEYAERVIFYSIVIFKFLIQIFFILHIHIITNYSNCNLLTRRKSRDIEKNILIKSYIIRYFDVKDIFSTSNAKYISISRQTSSIPFSSFSFSR